MARTVEKVRDGVSGFGVIGGRVADAVAWREDVELIRVSDAIIDYRIRVAEYSVGDELVFRGMSSISDLEARFKKSFS
jgi:glyceraldehyde-3-phosphate dehydrogenase/erythrose-4-phosphate dehydrogenase